MAKSYYTVTVQFDYEADGELTANGRDELRTAVTNVVRNTPVRARLNGVTVELADINVEDVT